MPGRGDRDKPRVLHIVTAPQAVRGLLRGQLRYLREAGFDVTVVSSPGAEAEQVGREDGVAFVPVRMEREIAPWRDLASLWRLLGLVRRLRPAIVHTGTPKAGLLGGLAAWLGGVPCRIYTLYGVRCETSRGWRRRLLMSAEWCACRLAYRVVCVSPSLRRKVVGLGIADGSRTVLLARGSANGIDMARFSPSPGRALAAKWRREQLGIPQDAPVAGFVGRLTPDKGVPELVLAFETLKDAYPDLRLLLIGPREPSNPLPEVCARAIAAEPRILGLGFIADPAPYYHVMDCVALPSHREGFPTVLLEAAAAAKPVVATDATGVADAVVHEVTGVITPVGDLSALSRALARVLDDPDWAAQLGQAARERAAARFTSAALWEEIVKLYRAMIDQQTAACRGKSPAVPAVTR